MRLSTISGYGFALSTVIILSACGGSSGSKKTNPTSGNNSSAGISSLAASSSISLTMSSVATSAVATSTGATSSSSSTGVSVVEDTTLVLPSSLEVVTHEEAH